MNQPPTNYCFLESPLAALEFELRNVLQLHLQKERPVFVEAARLHIEGRGPVVEFLLQGQQLGSDALGSQQPRSRGAQIVVERIIAMPARPQAKAG